MEAEVGCPLSDEIYRFASKVASRAEHCTLEEALELDEEKKALKKRYLSGGVGHDMAYCQQAMKVAQQEINEAIMGAKMRAKEGDGPNGPEHDLAPDPEPQEGGDRSELSFLLSGLSALSIFDVVAREFERRSEATSGGLDAFDLPELKAEMERRTGMKVTLG